MLIPFLIVIIAGILLSLAIFFIINTFIAPRKIEQLIGLFNQGKIAMVIKNAKKIIAKESRNYGAHYYLGLAYLKEENMDMALVELRTVNLIGIFDKYCPEIEFRKQIASLFMHFNQIEEALKEYLVLIRLQPRDAELYYQAGVLFELRRRNDMAVSYFVKTLELDKNHADAHFKLGVAYYNQKRSIEAKIELETALKLNAENYQAHYYLGRIDSEFKDFINALRHYEEAMKDTEFRPKALIERAACYMNMGNYEKAIAESQRALSLIEDESSSAALFARWIMGGSYEQTRDLDRAIEQWEKIYAKRPSFRNVAEKLSQYQELRLDDRVKDYLTANHDEFVSICQSVVLGMGLEIREATDIPGGCQILAVEAETKWRNARKMPKLVRFYRISDVIRDSTVRALHELIKKMNITRGVIFSSSLFAKSAYEYAETRPIDLFNQEKLREFLTNANIDYHLVQNASKPPEQPNPPDTLK
ncbi:MAG: restriction endonuclease [Spirochaetales bacterium]|nr:restriction endonuclease [Spirochaetales bacterium]